MGGLHKRGHAVLLVMIVLALSACNDRTTSPAAGSFAPRTPGKLTVVTADIPSPGFWEGTSTRLTGGFEYELAKLLAERFGLSSVDVKTESFHRIVAGHLNDADLALDLITPTNERSQYLQFSTPYLNAAPTVVARKSTNVPDVLTARKLRWGVTQGTTFVGILKSVIDPDHPARVYPSNTAEVAALEHGQIDALLLDLPLAVVTADDSRGRLHTPAQLPGSELIAAALPKGSGNTEAVSSAIRAFTSDGTIDDLLARWVGPGAADAEKSIPLLRTGE